MTQALTDLLATTEEGCDLAHYAAHAAAGVLVSNWLSAIRDGSKLSTLLHDVDEVVAVLREFKTQAAKLP